MIPFDLITKGKGSKGKLEVWLRKWEGKRGEGKSLPEKLLWGYRKGGKRKERVIYSLWKSGLHSTLFLNLSLALPRSLSLAVRLSLSLSLSLSCFLCITHAQNDEIFCVIFRLELLSSKTTNDYNAHIKIIRIIALDFHSNTPDTN